MTYRKITVTMNDEDYRFAIDALCDLDELALLEEGISALIEFYKNRPKRTPVKAVLPMGSTPALAFRSLATKAPEPPAKLLAMRRKTA